MHPIFIDTVLMELPARYIDACTEYEPCKKDLVSCSLDATHFGESLVIGGSSVLC